jgi:hypothetical protein
MVFLNPRPELVSLAKFRSEMMPGVKRHWRSYVLRLAAGDRFRGSRANGIVHHWTVNNRFAVGTQVLAVGGQFGPNAVPRADFGTESTRV